MMHEHIGPILLVTTLRPVEHDWAAERWSALLLLPLLLTRNLHSVILAVGLRLIRCLATGNPQALANTSPQSKTSLAA
jgi:hypothetical protein